MTWRASARWAFNAAGAMWLAWCADLEAQHNHPGAGAFFGLAAAGLVVIVAEQAVLAVRGAAQDQKAQLARRRAARYRDAHETQLRAAGLERVDVP
ncbi:hypothetical protein [Streptomyces cylindrosporus]|uniref:Uncharacterized protein n=1 Tax=Streptomyces cylindrosporus TaxID=2927583 RepID=A0ABS9YK99_9ACTN|nr:hypothetical protein [Streptomyces cylindrosporus]MCI3277590.1 hypothetical protein [Streptomyces cylindrosporus]